MVRHSLGGFRALMRWARQRTCVAEALEEVAHGRARLRGGVRRPDPASGYEGRRCERCFCGLSC